MVPVLKSNVEISVAEKYCVICLVLAVTKIFETLEVLDFLIISRMWSF